MTLTLANLCDDAGAYTEDLQCTRRHFVGTVVPEPQSWQGSWASSQGWPADVVDLADRQRDFGHQHGVREVSEPQVAFNDLPVEEPV